MTQAEKLERLIVAAISARGVAARRDLFEDPAGQKLVLAAFDLFEVDGLLALARDISREVEARREDWKVLQEPDRDAA